MKGFIKVTGKDSRIKIINTRHILYVEHDYIVLDDADGAYIKFSEDIEEVCRMIEEAMKKE